jgi:hypothetical protein
MTTYKRLILTALAVVATIGGQSGTTLASELQRHVAAPDEIQARIDQQIDTAAADRQAIQTMLQQDDVRRIAGTAGLDIERASAAVQVLSGSSLANLAAQARTVNADLVGGSDTIVISATTLIIILLVIIIVAN